MFACCREIDRPRDNMLWCSFLLGRERCLPQRLVSELSWGDAFVFTESALEGRQGVETALQRDVVQRVFILVREQGDTLLAYPQLVDVVIEVGFLHFAQVAAQVSAVRAYRGGKRLQGEIGVKVKFFFLHGFFEVFAEGVGLRAQCLRDRFWKRYLFRGFQVLALPDDRQPEDDARSIV